ncbi:FusB/FusC family EF-G-binding protein [Gracilibacillus kekensis]|uniref:FBP C-terminal treble-clef zinc-finger n=1 Tax=Gracilibacillus kekensis TaxID=1027249 RepID=A0A1M7Q7K6_9BACI|nr:FusB/FusC family EF-G-binding protein [Gracilibacillus kekensis]SHN26549.1 FBP C-terminal treble-clef zinc-finger [Gracilibacillus kekensis]
MHEFIYPHQFHLIKQQLKTIVYAKDSSTDLNVVEAVREMALERIYNAFINLTDDQKNTLEPIHHISNKEEMETCLYSLKKQVIPFPKISQQMVEKAFPKAKKLKAPAMENIDLRETVYLRWYDKGSNKTYMLAPNEEKLVSLQGFLEPTQHKGICSICNGLEEVSLFTAERKGRIRGTYSKSGNYICKDSEVCNQNISTLEHLYFFIDHIK